MVTVILTFDPEGQVKKSKKGPCSKFKILNIKHTFLIQFHLRRQWCILLLCTMSINGPKMRFNLMTSTHLTLITAIWGSNIEIRISNLACRLLLLCMSYTCKTVFDFLIGFKSKFTKKKWTFRDQNPKILKIWDSHFVENFISFVYISFIGDFFSVYWYAIDIAEDYFWLKIA